MKKESAEELKEKIQNIRKRLESQVEKAIEVVEKDKNREIFISTHADKMKWIPSINFWGTEARRFCLKNAENPDLICSKCYAIRKTLYQPGSMLSGMRNSYLLKKYSPEPQKMNYQIFRFNSLGELSDTDEYVFMTEICKRNPETMFALYTKRLDIVEKAERGMNRPKNLIVIDSWPYVADVKEPHADGPRRGAEKIFSIYPRVYAEKKSIQINCGAKSCNSCRICYRHGTATVVNELLK